MWNEQPDMGFFSLWYLSKRTEWFSTHKDSLFIIIIIIIIIAIIMIIMMIIMIIIMLLLLFYSRETNHTDVKRLEF